MPVTTAAPAPVASVPAGVQLLSPAQFAAAMAEPETVTVNVLGPGAPMIPGTDLLIAEDQLASGASKLPPLLTKLAVYCMHGITSAKAVIVLAGMGYKHIVELRGGMVAWYQSGRPVEASS